MAVVRKKVKRNVLNIEGKLDSTDSLRALASEKGIETDPLDIEGLVRALGIKLEYQSLPDDISGHLQKLDNDGWLITVNALHHPNRRRFTIAHELGHYFLHGKTQTDFVDTILFRSARSEPREWEANTFAANLLMPEDSFRSKIEQGVTQVENLAKLFDVSALAIRVRAKDLGYQGHGLN